MSQRNGQEPTQPAVERGDGQDDRFLVDPVTRKKRNLNQDLGEIPSARDRPSKKGTGAQHPQWLNFFFRSIRTQIMATTTLVIVLIISAVIWLWATNESEFYIQQKQVQAKSIAVLLAESWANELYDQNWSQIRLGMDIIARGNDDFVYILVSDNRLANQIVGSAPTDFQEQYVPDIVPVAITDRAVLVQNHQPLAVETFILRDLQLPNGRLLARRGDRVIEAAASIRVAEKKIGTFRVGLSLRELDEAVANAVRKALLVGVLGLGVSLISTYLLAKRISDPVHRLQRSAEKIAAGDLRHRAIVRRKDEIGALATAFNEMSAALQYSFSRLQRTLESFERFVPEKFLSVIAPEGIENIQVGVASTRTVTIMFCDIRGYTSLSEGMTPLATFAFLNDYLAYMGRAIDESGGFIDKYIGDAIMALFDDEATDGALQAALAMRKILITFNRERVQRELPPIDVGIGIHRGEVIMGTIGFTSRIESTVIGDSVNLASRLEGLTKHYVCSVLVTQPVINALQYPDRFQLRLVDEFVKVRGKDEPIAIYELQIPVEAGDKVFREA